jgi:hypothetical protein
MSFCSFNIARNAAVDEERDKLGSPPGNSSLPSTRLDELRVDDAAAVAVAAVGVGVGVIDNERDDEEDGDDIGVVGVGDTTDERDVLTGDVAGPVVDVDERVDEDGAAVADLAGGDGSGFDVNHNNSYKMTISIPISN